MGYGLVAVPRQLWRTADIKGAEKASYHKAGLQAEKAIAAKKYFAALWSPHGPFFCPTSTFSSCYHYHHEVQERPLDVCSDGVQGDGEGSSACAESVCHIWTAGFPTAPHG